MKLLIAFLTLGFAFAVLAGCRLHSIVDLQNPEFPPKLSPSDVSGELLDKYSVAGVIVEPQIRHGSVQSQYKLAVVFASKSGAVEPSVDDVSISVNGAPIDYSSLVETRRSEWLAYPNEPFFVCSISGPSITPPDVDMTKARVDISLTVAVTGEEGSVTKKQIDCHFIPKKRSYLE